VVGNCPASKDLHVTAKVENTKVREALRSQLALARRLTKTAKRGASMEVRNLGVERVGLWLAKVLEAGTEADFDFVGHTVCVSNASGGGTRLPTQRLE
jgi:hypothetical protein